jgi:putative zinc finger protein
MKACRAMRARILSAVDGTLALEAQFELEEHLKGCDDCQSRFEKARALEALLVRQSEPPLEQLDLERSLAAIRRGISAAEAGPSSGRRAASSLRRIALAASLLALFALAWTVWQTREGARPGAGPVQPSSPDVAVGVGVAVAPKVESAGSKSPDSPKRADPAPAISTPEIAAPETSAPELSAVDPEQERLDRERLARARQETRGFLVESAQLLAANERAPADEFAARFDELSRELARSGWPIRRLVEGLVGDPEPGVARAALRYLGQRGDRLSTAVLVESCRRPELLRAAVLAIADGVQRSEFAGTSGETLAPPGTDGLASVLLLQSPRTLLLATLVERGDRGVSLPLEAAVRKLPSAGPAARGQPPAARAARGAEAGAELRAAIDECVAALASLGAAPSLLRLGSEPDLPRESLIAALRRTPGAAEELSKLLRTSPSALAPGFGLSAIAALAPPDSVAWVEPWCLERDSRSAALDCLAILEDPEALRALLRLRWSSRVPLAELEPALALSLARNGQAASVLAQEWIRGERRYELQGLLTELCEHSEPASVPALIALSGTPLLPEADRRWSLLLAGELGVESDAPALAALLPSLVAQGKELAAACVLAIHSLGGSAAVTAALTPGAQAASTASPFDSVATPRNLERILGVLEARPRGAQPATVLFKLARSLEPSLTPELLSRRSTL